MTPVNRNKDREAKAIYLDERRLYAELGYRVKIAREVCGLSQTELGKKAGLSRVSITNLEGGRQRSPLTIIYRIAVALGMKPARLLPDVKGWR